MTTLADSLRATEKFSEDLSKLIAPLESYFGIKQFCYAASFTDGSLVHINTDLAVSEHFAYNGLDTGNPHKVSPDNMGSGMMPWGICSDYRAVVNMMERDFDLAYGVSFIAKQEDSYEVFAFSAPKESKTMRCRMYTDTKYLLRCVEYIKKEAGLMFREAVADYRIDITALKDNFYTQQGIIANETEKKKDLVKLLIDIGVVDPRLKNIRLTPQEKKCIALTIKGKSAKQTALVLGLSYRTVESYLATIKDKLGIQYTRELFDLQDSLIELEMLG